MHIIIPVSIKLPRIFPCVDFTTRRDKLMPQVNFSGLIDAHKTVFAG